MASVIIFMPDHRQIARLAIENHRQHMDSLISRTVPARIILTYYLHKRLIRLHRGLRLIIRYLELQHKYLTRTHNTMSERPRPVDSSTRISRPSARKQAYSTVA